MATIIRGINGQRAYPEIVHKVVTFGRVRSPRGLATRDLGLTIIELERPWHALPLGCGRDLNKNIAAAEAVQLIGGFTNPTLLTKAAPGKFEPFMDEGTFHGSYGRRIGYQVLNVINKLQHDPQTRQAVITLWDPVLDNRPDQHDYPCTVALHFAIEDDNELVMTTYMRSNDVWLGLPYDLFQFTQLQLSMAYTLDVGCGRYTHIAQSLHIYETDVEAAKKLHTPPTNFEMQPLGIGNYSMSFTEIMKRARRLTIAYADKLKEETESEHWYRDRFASYLGSDVDGDGTNHLKTVTLLP